MKNKFMNLDEYSVENVFKQIKESWNEPLEIAWTKDENEWIGIFNIDKNEYEIQILNFSKNGHWLFKFTANKGYELVNDVKKAFSVLPTIKKGAEDFITEMKPEMFIFCAADNSSGRKKLYNHFSHLLKDEFHLDFHIEKKENVHLFILHKPTYDGVEFSLSIVKIIKYLQGL